MYNFWVQVWSNYKGLFDWLNWRGYIANVIIYPIVAILMYAMLGRYALDQAAAIFFTIGMSVSLMTYNLISGITQSYANDRWNYTLPFLYVSGASRFQNYLSRAVLHYPNGLLVFITALAMIRLTTNVDFGLVNWAGVIPAVLVITASICAMAQFLGIFSIIFREWLNTLAFSLGISFIFSGVIVPLEVFPPLVQELAKLLPVTNGLTAIRAAFAGAALADIYWPILREGLTGLVYFGAGLVNFIVFERLAKRSGILDAEDIS
jgi:ABC-type polysaccharide/polyol phosphate export permease